MSVGRGTPDAFQRLGAPWLDASRVAESLNARRLPGLRFDVDSFTPRNAGDDKYDNLRIAGIRVVVVDRNAVRSGETAATIYWAIHRANRDSLRVDVRTFDERMGSAALREAIDRGEDPKVALAAFQPAVDAFVARSERFRLYR
jgi:uncharacterized protein YbbC (DUF1343 family)